MKNYELRKQVMGWPTDPDLRLGLLIVIDHFDWNTNEKVFASKGAFYQWVFGLSKRYRLNPQYLKEAVAVLKEAGAITVRATGPNARVFTLQEPTNTSDALAAYEDRKEEKKNG